MPEIKTEVRTFVANYLCDSCGKGNMIPTGVVQLSTPPSYEHECNNCGELKTFFDRKYPIVTYA